MAKPIPIEQLVILHNELGAHLQRDPARKALIEAELKNKDLSTPVKFLMGLFLMGIAFLVLVVGSMGITPQTKIAQVSMWYLVGFYFFQVIAEICQYPVCLSAVSKLSPKPIYSIMFGVYFTAIAIGNYLAGAISGYIEDITKGLSLSFFFLLSVIFLFVTGIIMAFFIPKLKRMMHGVS